MTARPMTEEERAEALQRCLWFVINVAPEYAYGAWAELEPQARALLSSSSAERGMREALETIATGYRDLNSCDFAALARVTSANALASLQQATRGEDAATASTDC